MALGRDAAYAARPIKLPVTLTGRNDPPAPFGFVIEDGDGKRWTATSYGVGSDESVRYYLTEFADGTGERREITADELAAMLNG